MLMHLPPCAPVEYSHTCCPHGGQRKTVGPTPESACVLDPHETPDMVVGSRRRSCPATPVSGPRDSYQPFGAFSPAPADAFPPWRDTGLTPVDLTPVDRWSGEGRVPGLTTPFAAAALAVALGAGASSVDTLACIAGVAVVAAGAPEG